MNVSLKLRWSYSVVVFAVLWCTLAVLYIPAARCGWVSDTLGWLDAVRNQSFGEYINRTHFGIRSLYQTTQLVTWCLYQLAGANQWAWHIIHLSLHALNCTLLYTLVRGLLQDCHLQRPAETAAIAAALFCISPYISEVIVWEAAFHFLQGLCFILIQISLLRRFLHRPNVLITILSCLLFAVSAFSLEVFYLTPFFTASLIFFYRNVAQHDKKMIRSSVFCLLLPQAILLFAHLVFIRIVIGTATARLGDALLHMPLSYYAVKAPDYFFHLLGGRFLPQAWRSAVHQAFCTYIGAGIFYLLLLSVLCYIIFRFRNMKRRGQVTGLFFAWMLLGIGIVIPMWFPERLLIIGDRYLYIMLPFFFAMVSMLMDYISYRPLRYTVGLCLLLSQAVGTVYLNRLWQDAQQLTDKLQQNFPLQLGKKILLLNNPQSLQGAPMIGAGGDNEFKLMHNLLYAPPYINAYVADILAYNLDRNNDSLDIRIINRRSVAVKLCRPGTRWWYNSDYARNYATPDYTVRLTDAQTYVLTFNLAPQLYTLLYWQDGIWKTVESNHPPE